MSTTSAIITPAPTDRSPGGAWAVLLSAALCVLVATAARGAVLFGQVDTFQNGLTAGWQEGAASPNPPSVVAAGGPAGADDAYLRNISSGLAGAGGRLVQFNQNQWAGNYVAAGVTRISLDMANFGTTDLAMRISLQGGLFGATRFASNNAVSLPAGSGWQRATFELTESALTSVVGSDSLSAVLSNVQELRVLSATAAPTYLGDGISAQLGVDNIRAHRLPGDADFNGVVDGADFNLLATNFGKTTGVTWRQGDFDFDGQVGGSDFNLLASNFSKTDGIAGLAGQLADVPEPTAIGAMGVAALAMTARRRQGTRPVASE